MQYHEIETLAYRSVDINPEKNIIIRKKIHVNWDKCTETIFWKLKTNSSSKGKHYN